jgi:6-phosphogluconate dehydrogenase
MAELEVLPTADGVAERAAVLAASWIEAKAGVFTIALSGGSTPRKFHAALAKKRIDWAKVHVFLSDDRALPKEHEHSNFRMAKETLFDRVPIPKENIHRIETELGPAEAARAYERAIRAVVPGGRIDLVMLGMGGDGHTASLFPGMEPAGLGLVVASTAPAETPAVDRVTFSYDALAQAHRVVALVTGEDKASRLAEIMQTSSLPLAKVLANRNEGTWVLADEGAAKLLPRGNVIVNEKADFGLVGLGVMGANIVLNVESRGFTVAVYNRTKDKTDSFLAENPGKRLVGSHSYQDLANNLKTPRVVMIMTKAGAPVDETIESLLPYLSKGDVVIDGGNEYFTNTVRRGEKLNAQGIDFVGMGVSGGEEGARHGPSLMPGGTRAAFDKIAPIVNKIAAQVADGPCVTYIGPGGAGHYVKMVHNGIEYGDMQLIAETYDVLKHVGGLTNPELAGVFTEWNKGELESFLIEITSRIFTKKDTETGQDLVDVILDSASMKGTGSWTVKEGADKGAAIPTIASSVDARVLSASRDLRMKGSEMLAGPSPKVDASAKAQIVADARAALYAAKACSYAQGLGLLQKASATHGWDLNLGEIARIWKGGCIIRAAFLGRIQNAYGKSKGLENLLFDADFRQELAARQDGWRRTIKRAIDAGIATPTLTASLAYYDSIRRKRLPANLTQAQRDFFGAHTYERLDRPGSFHTEW